MTVSASPTSASRPFFPTATFQPWVGDKYESEGLEGLRLLIVGDSHYDSLPTDAANLPKLTVDVVGNAIRDDGGSLFFFHRIGDVVSGHPLIDRKARDEFWQRVSFCNFFQRVLESSDAKPTAEDQEAALPIFRDVLDGLRPNAVLVTGYRQWNSIKPWDSVPRTSDTPRGTWLWAVSGLRMIAAPTVHPSWYRGDLEDRFIGSVWQARVARFVAEAHDWARDNPRPATTS